MGLDIITIGPLVVEIIRKQLNQEFHEAGEFEGPFASGDTPIFINAAALLGMKTGMIGSVGDDGFGKCVVDKLSSHQVDLTHLQQYQGMYTGSTFVTYYSDGSRKFLYHLEGSGSAAFTPDKFTADYFKGCKWVHYTGFSMEAAPGYREAAYRSLEMLDRETKVSFDPNIRPEIYTPEEIREMCEPILKRADLILPSGAEAMLFTGAASEEEGCRLLSEGGKKLVVLKRGVDGSRFFLGDEVIDVPAFTAQEVDPTGAGDTYAAALLTAFIEGKSIYDAGVFANGAGAFAVGKKGPMEGAPTRAQLDAFLASGKKELKASDW